MCINNSSYYMRSITEVCYSCVFINKSVYITFTFSNSGIDSFRVLTFEIDSYALYKLLWQKCIAT